MGKRFQITRGSATFIGSQELDPTLQITGEIPVQVAGRPAMNIRIIIGGTMSSPRLVLESDAQPPIPQTDLLSYLAFGRGVCACEFRESTIRDCDLLKLRRHRDRQCDLLPVRREAPDHTVLRDWHNRIRHTEQSARPSSLEGWIEADVDCGDMAV